MYHFSRDKIERGDFSVFLPEFGAEHLPTGPGLARLLGGLIFAVDGNDDDARETVAISESGAGDRLICRPWGTSHSVVGEDLKGKGLR